VHKSGGIAILVRNDNATLQGESSAILTPYAQTLDHPLKRRALKLNSINSGVIAANRTEAQKWCEKLHAPPLLATTNANNGNTSRYRRWRSREFHP
jgi:hypothetical protein